MEIDLSCRAIYRHNADDGDNCNQSAEIRAFAVTGTDKISDGGNVVLPADTDHLAQDKTPGKSHQGRAEIDCDKFEAAVGDFADAAVKSPGRAVDGQGQRINIRIRDNTFALKPTQIGIIGNSKKQEQIAQGYGGDQQISRSKVDRSFLLWFSCRF